MANGKLCEAARLRDSAAPGRVPTRGGSEKPGCFRWDARHGGRSDLGLTAEEVREVLPELVWSDEAGGASGLNYGRVGVLAVGAIQEMQAGQEQLAQQHERELRALRAENAELAARLAKLEAMLNERTAKQAEFSSGE